MTKTGGATYTRQRGGGEPVENSRKRGPKMQTGRFSAEIEKFALLSDLWILAAFWRRQGFVQQKRVLPQHVDKTPGRGKVIKRLWYDSYTLGFWPEFCRGLRGFLAKINLREIAHIFYDKAVSMVCHVGYKNDRKNLESWHVKTWLAKTPRGNRAQSWGGSGTWAARGVAGPGLDGMIYGSDSWFLATRGPLALFLPFY